MREKFVTMFFQTDNWIARQRIRRILRVRYGYILPSVHPRDPVWLSAVGM